MNEQPTPLQPTAPAPAGLSGERVAGGTWARWLAAVGDGVSTAADSVANRRGGLSAMRSNEIFVFAGAGLSRSMPSNLPTFPEVRSAVLCSARLEEFVRDDTGVGTARHAVASALLPEPFLSALHAAGVPVEGLARGWSWALLPERRPSRRRGARRRWRQGLDRQLRPSHPGPPLRSWRRHDVPTPGSRIHRWRTGSTASRRCTGRSVTCQVPAAMAPCERGLPSSASPVRHRPALDLQPCRRRGGAVDGSLRRGVSLGQFGAFYNGLEVDGFA